MVSCGAATTVHPSVVLELREDNAVIVEAAGATADLVGEGRSATNARSNIRGLERASDYPSRSICGSSGN